MNYDRIICVGDLHGCLVSLKRLFDKVKPTENDQLIFLGDYVDRGGKIPEIIDYLIEFKEQYPQTVLLKGNHEDLFLRYLSKECRLDDWRTFRFNGGIETIYQYTRYLGLDNTGDIKWDDLPENHKYFLQNLLNIHVDEDNRFIAVHAGLRPEVSIKDQYEFDLLWIRGEFLFKDYQWDDYKIVHGHTPMGCDEAKKYHEKYPSRFNVDNGCVYGKYLTCVDILTDTTYTVKSELSKESVIYVR